MTTNKSRSVEAKRQRDQNDHTLENSLKHCFFIPEFKKALIRVSGAYRHRLICPWVSVGDEV